MATQGAATRDAIGDLVGLVAEQRRTSQDAIGELIQRVDDFVRPNLPINGIGIDRASIAAQFLRGRGLEIGALHRPLPLPVGAVAQYVDAAPIDVLAARFPEVSGIQAPDIVDDGEHLRSIGDQSYDFIVANHFLEHTEDPFATLGTFIRVLRPGGRIFMAIPDKRWTFDREREITSLEHLLTDYRDGPDISRRGHYEEWLSVIDHLSGDELAKHLDAFIKAKINIHFHVWTIQEMSDMFFAARRVLGMPLEVKLAFADPPMLEVIWILEVTEEARHGRSELRG